MTAFDFNAPVADDIQESRDRWETFLNEVELNVYDWSGASLNNIVPSSTQFEKITFTESNGTPAVEINFNTGEINLADHMLLDEAAQLFWDRVMQMNPYPKQEVAVYSPGSRTEQFGFFPDAPEIRQVSEFSLTMVSIIQDEDEVNYNRAMKVVK